MKQDTERRFSSLARLYNNGAIETLAQTHVVIAGIGGVGSWAVEGLARSGVGKLTLIDLDNIAESNINRQIHALDSTLGASKIDVMKERISMINNQCEVVLYEDFLTLDNLSQFDFGDPQKTWIIDAIDQVKVKAAFIAWAKRHRYKLITTGAAGGKKDPTALMIDDLNNTYHDSLCARLKQVLRKEYGFPGKPKKMAVPVVFSHENNMNKPSDVSGGLNCSGYGSIVTVTANMGFIAASYVINKVLEEDSR